MALGPAQVHPEQHVGPIRGLGAACPGADGQDRRAVVVLAREQQGRALAREVGLERGGVALELGLELGVGGLGEQLDGGLEVGGARLEALPGLDLGAQAVGFAKDLLCGSLVVPEAGLERQGVELRDAFVLRAEVKGAPRSTGSVRPGRG
jgi:hypothetical protein